MYDTLTLETDAPAPPAPSSTPAPAPATIDDPATLPEITHALQSLGLARTPVVPIGG